MRRLYPSTLELLTFDTTARHLSMSRAADELCVTQGAVSRQIQQLEHWLGVRLFERVRQRLVLTDIGRTYLEQIRPSLAALEQATLALRHRRPEQGFTLSCSPTFGARWLIPRLPDFSKVHPDISFTFCPYGQTRDAVDLSIRYGEGVWPGMTADYLGGKELSVVFAARLGHLTTPGEILKHQLLHHASLPHAWEQWQAANGFSGEAPYAGPRFEQFSILIEAVIAGLGVGLVPTCLIERELRLGEVETLPSVTPPSWKGYYVTLPDAVPRHEPAARFRLWLLQQAQADRKLSRTKSG